MMKVEAILSEPVVDLAERALRELGVKNFALVQVAIPDPKGATSYYRGMAYVARQTRVKLEILVSSLQLDEVLDALRECAIEGKAGDEATIAVYELADAVRLRDGRRLGLTAY